MHLLLVAASRLRGRRSRAATAIDPYRHLGREWYHERVMGSEAADPPSVSGSVYERHWLCYRLLLWAFFFLIGKK